MGKSTMFWRRNRQNIMAAFSQSDAGGSTEPPACRLSPQERRWLLRVILVLTLLTTLPYGLAWVRQGADWRFTGFLLAVEDGNSYIAKMLLGRQGAWLFRSPYTLMPQAGYGLFVPYLLLGKLARLPGDLHTQLVALFHLFRVGALAALAVAVYRFVACFVSAGPWRRLAVVLILAGSGWDWMLLPWGRVAWGDADGPPSLISPEAYGFLALLALPHLALARALLLDGLARGARPRQVSPRLALGLALETALMVAVHPLEAVPWLLAVGLLLAGEVWRWSLGKNPSLLEKGQGTRLGSASSVRRAEGGVGAGGRASVWLPATLVALAAVAYLALLQTDPYVRLWTAQNRLPAPPAWVYLLAYGWLWPGWAAAWPDLRRRWRQGETLALWPGAWALLAVTLALTPVPIQRRLVEGAWVGGVVTAALGAPRLAARPWRRVLLAALSLAFVAPALLLWGVFRIANTPSLPAFRPAAEVAAFEALARLAAPGDAVLAAYATGNALPAWAPVRMPLGLGPESAPWEANAALVRRIYAGEGTPDERHRRLLTYGVRWVFYGPAERALGPWNPDAEPWLRRRYAARGYAFYEVLP